MMQFMIAGSGSTGRVIAPVEAATIAAVIHIFARTINTTKGERLL
jgi:hypothetical protein